MSANVFCFVFMCFSRALRIAPFRPDTTLRTDIRTNSGRNRFPARARETIERNRPKSRGRNGIDKTALCARFAANVPRPGRRFSARPYPNPGQKISCNRSRGFFFFFRIKFLKNTRYVLKINYILRTPSLAGRPDNTFAANARCVAYPAQ